MNIISITTDNRKKDVPEIQAVLTKYGNNIESRIGLHSIGKEGNGLIIIIYNSNEDIEEFVEELNQIKYVKVNFMEI